MANSRFQLVLKVYRIAKNWTQQQLADKTDCNVQTIARYEQGRSRPNKRNYIKLKRELGDIGLTYEEIKFEKLLELDNKSKELLKAIKWGRVKEIEEKLLTYKELLDEAATLEEDVVKEYRQYYMFGSLMVAKKIGLSDMEFLGKLVLIFQQRNPFPNMESIINLNFTEIEFELLCMIANVNVKLGNIERGKDILENLLLNSMCQSNPVLQNRYMCLASSLARLYTRLNDYETARKCLEYSFEILRHNTDGRTIFENLMIQLEICMIEEDEHGKEVIDDFLKSFQRLGRFMYDTYNIKRIRNL